MVATVSADPKMVECNHSEERLARVEQMIEALQREAAATKRVTAKLVVSVAALTPQPPVNRKPLARRP
jgi:hypothetical protein